jgi:short-subunit dehydrogenase
MVRGPGAAAVEHDGELCRRWKRALVTGASSGIGRAIARQLADRGTELVVVARDESRLRSLVDSLDVECEVLVCDLADREALEAVELRIESTESPIDLLVNNAGLGFGGSFVDLDRDAATFVVDVNVVALQRLTQAAASSFSERGAGTILNVGSLAGDAVGANTATYNATKAFVTSLGQSLAAELAGSGVTITTLLPGFTRTEFQQRSGTDVSDVPGFLWQSPESVAAAGLDGAAAGLIEVVPKRRYRAFRAVNRVLPGAVKRRAATNVVRRSAASAG